MSAGTVEELRGVLSGRIWLSLHGRAPDQNGQPLIAGPLQLPAGSFQITGGAAVNVRDIWFTAASGGRVTHVGRWTASRKFIVAGPLRRPVDVVTGQRVRIPRGMLRIGPDG